MGTGPRYARRSPETGEEFIMLRTIESRLLLLSALALAVAALGCNRGNGDPISKGAVHDGGAVAARPASTPSSGGDGSIAVTTAAVGGVAETPLEAESTPRGEDTEVTPAEYLPPDVAVPTSEMLVTPGSVVEITAEGSSDVVEVVLTDDLGTTTNLQYDGSAGLWRTSYRVPLRMKGERVGLSVTAKNGTQRWRRVWVFLKDARGAAADTTRS
jgi:hypothetical protein